VLLEEAPRELRVLGVHTHARRELTDFVPGRVAGDREHHADRAGGRLRVVQLVSVVTSTPVSSTQSRPVMPKSNNPSAT
jgi:hypothetical protein